MAIFESAGLSDDEKYEVNISVPLILQTYAPVISKRGGMSFNELVKAHKMMVRYVNQGNVSKIREHFSQSLSDESTLCLKCHNHDINFKGMEKIFEFVVNSFDAHPDGILSTREMEIVDLGHFKALKTLVEFSSTIVGETPLLDGYPHSHLLSDFIDPTLYTIDELNAMRERELQTKLAGNMIRCKFKIIVSIFYDEIVQAVRSIHHRSVLVSFHGVDPNA